MKSARVWVENCTGSFQLCARKNVETSCKCKLVVTLVCSREV